MKKREERLPSQPLSFDRTHLLSKKDPENSDVPIADQEVIPSARLMRKPGLFRKNQIPAALCFQQYAGLDFAVSLPAAIVKTRAKKKHLSQAAHLHKN
ncbi:MAG: hypothetical protein ABIK28_10830 [Planctomycetota bacterium]